jgi:hypothetical protein
MMTEPLGPTLARLSALWSKPGGIPLALVDDTREALAGIELDLVVVSSPMSIAGNAIRLAPDQPLRRVARLTLAGEVARVRRRGTRVLVFQPTPAEVGVMGLNAMDPARRAEVARNARESTQRRLARDDARELVRLLEDAGVSAS